MSDANSDVIDEKYEREEFGCPREGEGKERKRTKPYVPRLIFANALRNATWTVSFGATVVLSKSEAICETVQNAQRQRRPNEHEKTEEYIIV